MNWYKLAQESRRLTVQNMGSYREIVPIITLRGKWLLGAGFYPKDQVSVSVSNQSITLSVSAENAAAREYEKELNMEKAEKERYLRENPGKKINIPKL